MFRKEGKKAAGDGRMITLQEEINRLNDVTEQYSRVQGEVEELEQSLPTLEELQRMEREKYSMQDVKERLKLLKGEVAIAGEDVRKSRERLQEAARKHKKTPWRTVAVFELVAMIALGGMLAGTWLKNRESVPSDASSGSQTVTPGPDNGDGSAVGDGAAELTPMPEEEIIYGAVEDLKARVARLDADVIAPFTAKVEEIDGMEYLTFVYEDLKISYANGYRSTEREMKQRMYSSVLQPFEQTIRMEKGSRMVVYPWSYSLEGDLASLAPEYVAYTGAEGNQLIFFCNGYTAAAETEAEAVLTEGMGLPQEIRMVDAEYLWEYKALDVEAAIRAQFAVEYTYAQTDAESTDMRTMMKLTVGSAVYPYEISYRTYEAGLLSAVSAPLDLSEFFKLELTDERMSFEAVVYTQEKEYLGEISGEIAVVDRELVLKDVKYGAYVSPYHENPGSDGVIIPRTARMQEHITISGKNRQRYYIALSDEVERIGYDWSRMAQNENGYFEYFDEAGNKISFTGIDVSKYQGDIDWKQVKAAGIDYAIIRLGYRGMNEGTLELDPYYEQNIAEANAAGVPVGVYFFSQAVTVEEAVAEAQMVLDHINGYEVSYPIVFDTEVVTTYDARANKLPRDLRTDICIAFCETIKEAGYQPMVYANTKWMIMGIDLERLTEYDKWYAYYGTTFTFPYQYQMLQYSDSGSVPGIKGAVDLDISFVDYSKDFVN